MRTMFRSELVGLMSGLASMARLSARMMTIASVALHQADSALAERVVADRDRLRGVLGGIERRCLTLLALQAPVAGDLRVVVAALHMVGHLRRMGELAQHIALVVWFEHPNPMASCALRPVLARIGLLAIQQAEDAATAIERQDSLSGRRLAVADDELDAMVRQLFGILLAPDWSHGVERAVNAALIGRYCERFGDHAVAVAAQACYVSNGQIPRVSALSGPV